MEGIGCYCILGIDFVKSTGAKVNFLNESVTFDNLEENVDQATHKKLI